MLKTADTYPQFVAGRYGRSTRTTARLVHISSGTLYIWRRGTPDEDVSVRWRCGRTGHNPEMADAPFSFMQLCRLCAADEVQAGVYFAERGGLIKIGCSQHPGKRAVYLDARLLASQAGDFETERTLHRVFADDRVVGEWFRPSPALLAYIERVRAEPQSEPVEQAS